MHAIRGWGTGRRRGGLPAFDALVYHRESSVRKNVSGIIHVQNALAVGGSLCVVSKGIAVSPPILTCRLIGMQSRIDRDTPTLKYCARQSPFCERAYSYCISLGAARYLRRNQSDESGLRSVWHVRTYWYDRASCQQTSISLQYLEQFTHTRTRTSHTPCKNPGPQIALPVDITVRFWPSVRCVTKQRKWVW